MRAAQSRPESIPDVMWRLAGELDATDVVVYLVDFAQTSLEPMPDLGVHVEAPRPEPLVGSMAGRAYIDGAPTISDRADGTRIWVPVVEGSDRTGVLAMTVPAAGDAMVGLCEELGLLAGHLIATHARTTDLYNLRRRRRALSLAASMQWDLLPPLVLKTPRMAVAGIVEPAYEVGGDCFDYALNDAVFNIALIDAMGHGVASAVISALAVGSYRHDRREGRTLEQVHTSLDDAIATYFADYSFATGQSAQIDVETGTMRWTNAGHPPPLLIRGEGVRRELDCPPTPPWGLGSVFKDPKAPQVATESLEPGDSVLFYTDGVIEAHVPGGEPFGIERLADMVGRHASDQTEPEEIVRHVVGAVLGYNENLLADDATVVLVRWNGPSPRRSS